MADHLAIKRLSASDCTLFEAVFRTADVGNQKSINLNADVLIDKLYPALGGPDNSPDHEIGLPITIYGPGKRGAHKLTRKIIKNATYKNWRLNGEFIYGPPEDPTRYNSIAPADLAVMVFKGDGRPSALDMILISRADTDDQQLHAELTTLFGNRSMISVSSAQIADAAARASAAADSPILRAAADPIIEAALEDAAQGGIVGISKILSNRACRKVTKAELTRAKVQAELIGQDGEGLLNGYLADLVGSGRLRSSSWTALANAVAPHDFEVEEINGDKTLIDAKTTNGPFENAIHLSLAEVEAAGSLCYRIYRIYELDENGGKLRISDDIGPISKQLKEIHEKHIPSGVRVDSFSLATSSLHWGQERYLERQDDGDAA